MALNARIILAGIMLTIFAAMVGTAFSYPAKAALVPLVVGIPGTILCLIQLGTELRAVRLGTLPVSTRNVRREWVMFGWLVGFVTAVTLLGFLIAAPLALYCYLRFNAKTSQLVAVLMALGGVALIYGVFEYGLQVDLWDGLLTPIVADWFGIS